MLCSCSEMRPPLMTYLRAFSLKHSLQYLERLEAALDLHFLTAHFFKVLFVVGAIFIVNLFVVEAFMASLVASGGFCVFPFHWWIESSGDECMLEPTNIRYIYMEFCYVLKMKYMVYFVYVVVWLIYCRCTPEEEGGCKGTDFYWNIKCFFCIQEMDTNLALRVLMYIHIYMYIWQR